MTDVKEKLKRGHRRDDGMILWASAKGYETWVSPSEFLAKKESARIAMIEWRKINPLKSRAFAKKYREKNLEKAKQSYLLWRKNNPEKFREKQKKWALNNRQKIKGMSRESYRKQKLLNPEKMREKSRVTVMRWRINNPEKAKDKMRKWQIENAAKTVIYTQKREAAKIAAIPADYWESVVDGIYVIAERVSKCLGIKHEVDHIWPISKGGSHCHRNLQVIPAALNRKKSARLNFALPSCYQSEGWRVQNTAAAP